MEDKEEMIMRLIKQHEYHFYTRTSRTMEQIEILLNRIFSFNNIAIRSSEGRCPQMFIREKSIMPVLMEYSNCGQHENIIIVALLLVDRLTKKNRFYLNKRNVYNLLMIGILLSTKFLDDEPPRPECYSIIFQTPQLEINRMERKFLKLIDYQLLVSTDEFTNYRQRLMSLKK